MLNSMNTSSILPTVGQQFWTQQVPTQLHGGVMQQPLQQFYTVPVTELDLLKKQLQIEQLVSNAVNQQKLMNLLTNPISGNVQFHQQQPLLVSPELMQSYATLPLTTQQILFEQQQPQQQLSEWLGSDDMYKLVLPMGPREEISRPDQLRVKLNSVERELIICTENIRRVVKLPENVDLAYLQVRVLPFTVQQQQHPSILLNRGQQQKEVKLLVIAPYKQSQQQRFTNSSTISRSTGSYYLDAFTCPIVVEHQLGGVFVEKYFKQLEHLFGSERTEEKRRLIKTRCVPLYRADEWCCNELYQQQHQRPCQIEIDLLETKHFLPQQVTVKKQQRKNKITGEDEVVVRVEAKRQFELDGSAQEVVREFVAPHFVDNDKVDFTVGPCDGTVRIRMPVQLNNWWEDRREESKNKSQSGPK